ncbi:MAG: hypothetical protein F6K55_03090 [Moorea sp. SIO4A3]|nr:hypothetical protein [Moorena sp. SIO4A3]
MAVNVEVYFKIKHVTLAKFCLSFDNLQDLRSSFVTGDCLFFANGRYATIDRENASSGVSKKSFRVTEVEHRIIILSNQVNNIGSLNHMGGVKERLIVVDLKPMQ